VSICGEGWSGGTEVVLERRGACLWCASRFGLVVMVVADLLTDRRRILVKQRSRYTTAVIYDGGRMAEDIGFVCCLLLST